MFKQDNLKSLFRSASPKNLQEYFNRKGLLKELDFEKEKVDKKANGFVEFLIDVIEQIQSSKSKGEIKSELNKVFLMRDKKSLTRFIREGELKKETLEKIKEVNNFDQSLILFLEEEKRFEEFYFVYGVSSKSHWGNARTDYVAKNQDLGSEVIDNLVEDVKNSLKQENKGSELVKKVVELGDKLYIFAFYQDSIQEMEKIEDGDIKTFFSDSVGKAVFLYDKKNGIVKTYGEDNAIRNKMHKSFAKEVFKQLDIEEEQPKNDVYDLGFAFDQLTSNKKINFDVSGTKIEEITPVSVRVKVKNRGQILDILVGERNNQPNDLYESLAMFFASDAVSQNEVGIEELEPLWMEFTVKYPDPFDNKRKAKSNVKITCKNKISGLGENEIDFEIMDCLRAAGILKNKEEKAQDGK